MSFQTLIVIAATAYAFYFMRKISQSKQDGPFTTNEKIQVIVTMLLSPLISWAIYHFGWKNALPQKAKHVNTYLLRIILALVAIAVVSFLVAMFFSTVKPLSR